MYIQLEFLLILVSFSAMEILASAVCLWREQMKSRDRAAYVLRDSLIGRPPHAGMETCNRQKPWNQVIEEKKESVVPLWEDLMLNDVFFAWGVS